MTTSIARTFAVHKEKLSQIELLEEAISPLETGEILLSIDLYALTTNNITYAIAAPKLKYWEFFPAPDALGIIPVWGFANVVESKHPEVGVGERVFGYFPMSNFLKIQVNKVSPYGFADVSAHRQGLSPIYNYYTRTSAMAGYHPSTEAYQPLLKPLFSTSFLNSHFLADENFFGADQIVITSASSKTALGLAFCLSRGEYGKKIVGLTSNRNVEFVQHSGFYDQVIPYEEVASQLAHIPTTIVDMAGNSDLLQEINQLLTDKLKHISLIGITDWQAAKEFKQLAVARFFFAPTFMQKKNEEWGMVEAQKKITAGFGAFVEQAKNWISIQTITQTDELSALYLEMLGGKVNPAIGYIVKI